MSVIRAPFAIPSKSMICYVLGDKEDSLPESQEEIQKLVLGLTSGLVTEVSSSYCVAFLWQFEGVPAVDLWTYSDIDKEPNPDVRLTFRCDEWEAGNTESCENSVIILGREAELRRSCPSLEAFITGPRPQLPDYLIGWK